jgi:DNA-binding HxlR family transcriptional regulator
MITHHSFSVSVAVHFADVNRAILLEHIAFLSRESETAEVKRSAGRMRKTYPYLTECKIRLSLARLEADGYISVTDGRPDDPTKTYMVTDKGWALLGVKPEQKKVHAQDDKKEASQRLRAAHDAFFGKGGHVKYRDADGMILPAMLFTSTEEELTAIERAFITVLKRRVDVVLLVDRFITHATAAGKTYVNLSELRLHLINYTRKVENVKEETAPAQKRML